MNSSKMFLYLGLGAFLAFLVACDSESSVVAASTDKKTQSFSSLADLPSCKSGDESMVVSIKNEDAFYVCKSGEWIKLVSTSEELVPEEISCKMEKLSDKKGEKVICNGDSVGVVKYPTAEEEDCVMVHDGSMVTVTCGESKIEFDVSTFYEPKVSNDLPTTEVKSSSSGAKSSTSEVKSSTSIAVSSASETVSSTSKVNSSSSNTSSPIVKYTTAHYTSVSEIPQCIESRNGMVASVNDEVYFVCNGISWIKLVDASTLSSSSAVVLIPSSSSIPIVVRSSSSSYNYSYTCSMETWAGYNAEYQVQTGLDDGSETYGYWYEYNDNKETSDNGPGTSKIVWPVVKGNEYSDEALDPIIDYCGGLCGTAVLGGPYDYPFAGVAFNLTGMYLYGADISGWGGLCISYISDGISPALEIVPEDEILVTGGNNYKARLPITKVLKTVDLAWSDFEQDAKGGTIVSRASVLTDAAKIRFNMAGIDGQSTFFNVVQIGGYGKCGSVSSSYLDVPPSSSSSSTSSNGCGDLWCGRNGDYRVETGFDDETDTYGYWFEYNDSYETADNGPGTSTITWPVDKGNAYSDIAFDPIIDECGGLCGIATMGGPYKYPFVGIGFNLSGNSQTGNDISGWDGICISYMSTGIAPALEIVPEDELTLTEYNNYKASLGISDSVTTVDLAWSDFKQDANWGKKVDRASVLAVAAVIKFRLAAADGKSTDFNLVSIGRYGSCSH